MSDCLFCNIATGKIPSHIVYEDEHTIAFLDIYPAAKYHTLVIPKKHSTNMFDIQEEDALHVMRSVQKVVKLLREKIGIEHLNLINNSGEAAGQTIFHTHIHIIPRSDGNPMIYTNPTYPEMSSDFDDMLKSLNQE